MRNLIEIARQEFKMTAANKTFLVMTILGPFLIFAVSILPALLSNPDGPVKEGTIIGIVSPSSDFTSTLSRSFSEVGIDTDAAGGMEAQRTKVLNGEIKGFLYFPEDYLQTPRITYYTQIGTEAVLNEIIKNITAGTIITERLKGAGFDAEKISLLSKGPEMDIRKISKTSRGEQQNFLDILLTAIAFVMLLYMTTLLYGQMIGRSVVLEKTSKTVEIMLSSAHPRDLLFGKIIGKGAAGLLQYTIWIFCAVILIKTLGPLFNFSSPLPIKTNILGFLVVFFVLGFLLYSSAFAALGAAAVDEAHLGQLSWPLILFLVIPMVLVSPIVMNPNSLFVKILSYFPLTSSIVMFIRTMISSPPAWEIFISIAVLLCSIVFTIMLASKIFRVGILMTGKRFKIKEIIKWLNY